MRIALREHGSTPALERFEATLPARYTPALLLYRTRTGATLSIDGLTAGAFDREHHDVLVEASSRERTLVLEVERFSLPTNRLPAGDGILWRAMVRSAHQRAQRHLDLIDAHDEPVGVGQGSAVFWGHSHLDVAWLWNYTQARRKAVRTFANAAALCELDPGFVFMQSQPQLYEFVREDAPGLFEEVRRLAHEERFDPDVAALWVEPDANIPSGESVLRQLLFAHHYVVRYFGIEPGIAWLPDTFGFPNTLPTLLAHAGVPYFATTKLQWNDTTRFPHAQFRWRGPDGSEVIAAMLDAYEGPPDDGRAAIGARRGEPVVVGYGDGGGGPTRKHLHGVRERGRWERPRAWFERLKEAPAVLPLFSDELYLEYHRGTYTTHHDCKVANASFERRLAVAEERLAWCVAVHAPRDVLDRLRGALDDVWRDVLRNQFHDVLAGAAIRDAYVEAHELYERAGAALALVESSTSAMLPRGRGIEAASGACAPSYEGDDVTLDNGLVRAVFDAKGALSELATPSGRNAVSQGNILTAYRDRPKKWDAWNLDAGYERHHVPVRPTGMELARDAVEYRFVVGRSPVTMRVELRRGEPFVRVTCAVDWRERHTILRLENWLALTTDGVTYGAPHGTIVRTTRRDTPALQARFEVPGQRFAAASDAHGGVALLALDTYGWSARALRKGGVHLGHSLLRSPSWPDPLADRGVAALSWAFAPFDAGVGIGAIEQAWEQFAMQPRVRFFTSQDSGLAIVACKPAADGNGVIVRVRECDGTERPVRIRSGARMRGVEAVDALERPTGESASIEGEQVVARVKAFGLRSFRVRF